jgi:hypothetical protein
MKTAMELALARIEMLYIEKDSIHWEMFKNDCIEKEKLQIIDAYYGKINGIFGYREEGEEYYNQTYNLNK